MFISIKENPKRVTAILLVLAWLLSFCGISVYADTANDHVVCIYRPKL